MSEITLDELKKLNANDYELIDIRDSTVYEYGRMDNAVNIPLDGFDKERLDKSKKNILYCKSGILSINIAEELRSEGYDAYSLKEGYIGWLRQKISAEDNDKERLENIEKSIRKKFHKVLFSKFAQAINQYKLVEENDRIAVCISGGKDSMLMAKLFQELLKHNKFHFELVFLVMDPGYSSENREIIEHNARLLNIPITVFESTIFDSVYNIEKSPCYVCARMRRGYLYSKAKELGCNKIALGHHFDDVIETILPFNQEIEINGLNENSQLDINAVAEDLSFSMLSEKEVEIRLTVSFDAVATDMKNGSIITAVTESENEQPCQLKGGAVIYTVKKGDTLWNIAKKYHTTVEDIVKINKIENPDLIYPCQRLLIFKKFV